MVGQVTHLKEGDDTGDTEIDLYAEMLKGNDDAVVQNLLPRLRGYICKNFPPLTGDAESLAVDAIERVYEKIDKFDGRSQFITWAIGIARNVARECLRSRIRIHSESLSWSDLPETVPSNDPTPEQAALESTTREINALVAEEALEQLTDLQRKVFELKHRGNLNAVQIAGRLGPPNTPGSVRSALVDASRNIERWRTKNGYGGQNAGQDA